MDAKPFLEKANLQRLLLYLFIIVTAPFLPLLSIWIGLIIDHYFRGPITFYVAFLFIGYIAHMSFFLLMGILFRCFCLEAKFSLVRYLTFILIFLLEAPLAFWYWSTTFQYYMRN